MKSKLVENIFGTRNVREIFLNFIQKGLYLESKMAKTVQQKVMTAYCAILNGFEFLIVNKE
jgi:hypothetical protein